MESWVSTCTVFIGQIPVLQIVLNVSKLVMGGDQVVVGYSCALFDSKDIDTKRCTKPCGMGSLIIHNHAQLVGCKILFLFMKSRSKKNKTEKKIRLKIVVTLKFS